MDPYLGEIRMFAGQFAPTDWKICDGSILPIVGYENLYSLIGTTYGGDGSNNFKLPDLRGRAPVHSGTGTGLEQVLLGKSGGTEKVTVTTDHLPPHTHSITAQNLAGTKDNPSGNFLANAQKNAYATVTSPLVPMNSAAVGPAGGGNTTVSIVQPYMAVNFIIAIRGIYPQS